MVRVLGEAESKKFLTLTVTESCADPPGPEQEREYVVVVVRLPVFCEPEVPDQPVGETEQEVALVDDQVIVVEEL